MKALNWIVLLPALAMLAACQGGGTLGNSYSNYTPPSNEGDGPVGPLATVNAQGTVNGTVNGQIPQVGAMPEPLTSQHGY